MTVLYSITSGLFLFWVIRNTFFWISLWQTKEYRLDRLLAHLKETSQGRSLLFSSLNLLKCLAIFGYILVVINETFFLWYALLIFAIYLYEMWRLLIALFTRRFKRPVLTGKAGLLVVMTLFVIFGLYILGIIQQGFLWILILDKLTPFVIAFFVFFLSVPTMLYQDYKIDQAIRKMEQFPKILVIGITGSFGKSSTKEYAAQILSRKFIVAKSPGTNNTPIGLANTVLKYINNKTEIFVAEMGAYKKGEVAQLCEIAQPTIGIVTAVSAQHLSLFGSLENVAQTKYELIESLPVKGIGLFNANNQGAYALYNKTKKTKVAYATDILSSKHVFDILATQISVKKESVSFVVVLKKKKMYFTASLIGKHAIENLLPGIYLAHYLGMSGPEIKKAVASLTQLPKTMTVHFSIRGTALIDDTFNVNPDAVIAAIEYAQMYKGKKVVVLEPMIELGGNAKEEHYRVGRVLAHACDYVFLTKKNFYDQLIKGISDAKGKCQVKIAKSEEIASYVNNKMKKNDIVIFEGKESASSLHHII